MITKEIEIPEGFKIKSVKVIGSENDPKVVLELEEKKAKNKTFTEYVVEYFIKKPDRDKWFDKNACDFPFEYKIGLLKLICDDLGFSYSAFMTVKYLEAIKQFIHYRPPVEHENLIEKITKICPAEFIESILKS